MPTSQSLHSLYHPGSPPGSATVPELHVFEQDGGWQWGITIPRAAGSGFKLIAFSERTFSSEDTARADGAQALTRLANSGAHTPCTTDAA